MVGGLDCLEEFDHMLMVQVAVDGYLFLEHVHVAASELAQVDDLDGHSDVRSLDIHSFEDATAVPLTQLFRSVVFVFSHSHLTLSQTASSQLLPRHVSRKGLAGQHSQVIL